MNRGLLLFLAAVGWGALSCPSRAATNAAYAVDAAGLWSSNSTRVCVTAAGQGSPVGAASSTRHILYGGFLHAFVMFTNLDHDADGIIDENDPDDDNDGIPDSAELAGTSFDPNTATDPMVADSDGDGAMDRAESVAGTDPLNAASRFAVEDITFSNDSVTIAWAGRENRRYAVLVATNAAEIRTDASILTTVTAVNGSGPWQETVTEYAHDTNVEHRIYRVKIEEN